MNRYDIEFERGRHEPWERSRFSRREHEGRRFDPENYENRMDEEFRDWQRRGYENQGYGVQGAWGRPYSSEYPSQDWERQYGRESYGRPWYSSGQYGYGGGQYGSDYSGEQFGGGRFGSGQFNRGQYGTGRFYGRGPKGYQRSDQRILEEINDRLTEHPEIDASDIEVKVNNGEVTISGMVVERMSKRLAEDVAEGVMGVKQVHNQVRIQHETPSRDAGTGTRKAAAGESGHQQHEFAGTSRR